MSDKGLIQFPQLLHLNSLVLEHWVLLSCRCDCKSAKFCIIKGHDLYGSLYIITETQILLNEIKTLPTAKPQNPDYNTILIKAKHEVSNFFQNTTPVSPYWRPTILKSSVTRFQLIINYELKSIKFFFELYSAIHSKK